jgi:hypothetical protein
VNKRAARVARVAAAKRGANRAAQAAILDVMKSNPSKDWGVPFGDLVEAFDWPAIRLLEVLNAMEAAGKIVRVKGAAVMERRYRTA